MKEYSFETEDGCRVDGRAKTAKKALKYLKKRHPNMKFTGYYFKYDKDGYHLGSKGWDGCICETKKNKGWIEYGLPYGTFQPTDLNCSGTSIQTKDSQYLIGDINELGGVCDCCTGIRQEEIILRYKKEF